jgi:hypothetical protein
LNMAVTIYLIYSTGLPGDTGINVYKSFLWEDSRLGIIRTNDLTNSVVSYEFAGTLVLILLVL